MSARARPVNAIGAMTPRPYALVHPLSFSDENRAMEPADPFPRAPYPLERRTFMAMAAGGLLAAPLAAELQQSDQSPDAGGPSRSAEARLS